MTHLKEDDGRDDGWMKAIDDAFSLSFVPSSTPHMKTNELMKGLIFRGKVLEKTSVIRRFLLDVPNS